MNKELKVRIFALGALAFITIFPFVAKLYPQILPFVTYPLIAIYLAIMPIFFAYLFAPVVANKLVKTYTFYHKIRNRDFRIYEGRFKSKISISQVAFLTSLYPLGIIFKITDNPIAMNEIDMQFVSLVFVIQFLTIIFSYSIFVISKSKLMVEFNNATSRFSIGEKLREKINYGVIGSYLLIFFLSFDAITSNHYLFFVTLLISVVICFGSNFVGFYLLEKRNLIQKSVLELKRILHNSNYKPKYF